MSGEHWAAGGAWWLGVLTALSPCMMATTVAAISFIARRVSRLRHVLASGLLYTAAQALTYTLLAAALVDRLLSAESAAQWLRLHIISFLGPILLVMAVFLLEWVSLPAGSGRLKQKAQRWAETGGLWAAALLGMIFAMSFCPTTAALFFGGLVPLAFEHESRVFLPLCYAAGVSLPVMGFGVVIAFAAHRVGMVFKRVALAELWARRITGALFLASGLYFTLAYTLNII